MAVKKDQLLLLFCSVLMTVVNGGTVFLERPEHHQLHFYGIHSRDGADQINNNVNNFWNGLPSKPQIPNFDKFPFNPQNFISNKPTFGFSNLSNNIPVLPGSSGSNLVPGFSGFTNNIPAFPGSSGNNLVSGFPGFINNIPAFPGSSGNNLVSGFPGFMNNIPAFPGSSGNNLVPGFPSLTNNIPGISNPPFNAVNNGINNPSFPGGGNIIKN